MIAEYHFPTCNKTLREATSGMTRPPDGCARVASSPGAGAPAAPLSVGTADPVLCLGCGNVFGRGAEAGTVCPYCSGPLHPLPGARESLEGTAFPPAGPGTEEAP